MILKGQATRRATLDNGELEITLQVAKEDKGKGYRLETDKLFEIEFRSPKSKRSVQANRLLWTLLDKIATALKSTKEDVYRDYIHKVGKFDILAIKNEAVDRFIKGWASKGLGWSAVIQRDSKFDGFKAVVVYYGTSAYTVEELNKLIEEVKQDCDDLGLDTLSECDRSL